MDGKSQNITAEQKQKLKELFPEVFTEDKIDWEKLKATLGKDADLGERYGLSWKGKNNVFRAIQEQTTKTLKPVPEESVDWENTKNLFIEGDNLEVLKVLHKAYYGQVKMIYIDPPYNTGNDFVYNDKFAQTQAEYEQEAGIRDDTGSVKRVDGLRKNSKDGGHFHSNWLNMIYPRLYLARNLLRQDGVIFVSIDDNEVHNLRLIMNEIFGEENFVAQLVWEKGRKNDAKLISTGHEYMLLYAKSLQNLKDDNTVWREPKPGAKEVWDQYLKIKEKVNSVEEATVMLRQWYETLPKNHPSKKLSRYKHVDKYGPWRDSDISWPGGGGPRYDVIHPVTHEICKVPERGWRFASPQSMQHQIDLGLVVFRKDHTEPPIRKAHLVPPIEELTDDNLIDDDVETEEAEIGMQVLGSVIYKQSQVAVKLLRKLMGAKVFDNPKDHDVLKKLISYVGVGSNDIVMDFFAGSATTAHAVNQLNAEENKDIRWICIQLAEETNEKSEARKSGYENIADVAKERIRLANTKISKDYADEIRERESNMDVGFRVYKLSRSNFKVWRDDVNDTAQLTQQLFDSINPIVSGAAEQHLLSEILVKNGIKPTEHVEKVGDYYYIPSSGLAIVLDLEPTQDIFTNLLEKKPKKIILLDIALKNNDQLKANLLLQSEQNQLEVEVI